MFLRIAKAPVRRFKFPLKLFLTHCFHTSLFFGVGATVFKTFHRDVRAAVEVRKAENCIAADVSVARPPFCLQRNWPRPDTQLHDPPHPSPFHTLGTTIHLRDNVHY